MLNEIGHMETDKYYMISLTFVECIKLSLTFKITGKSTLFILKICS